MRRSPVIRVIAFILLFVFIQKMGAGLYLHHWLHVQNCDQYSVPVGDAKVAAYSCTCFDEFSIPFTEVAVARIAPASMVVNRHYRPGLPGQPVLATKFHSSLRGPPQMRSNASFTSTFC